MIETFEFVYQVFWIVLALVGAVFILALVWSLYLYAEEKKREKEDKMITKNDVKTIGIGLLVMVVFVACIFLLPSESIHMDNAFESPIETKTLTILHTWEEGGKYYFADELGRVYLIGCWGDNREIRYADMPKIRFDKLEEGHRYNVEYGYNVEYVLKKSHVEHMLKEGNVRLSLGEEEMER